MSCRALPYLLKLMSVNSFNAFSEQTLIKTAILCNLHMTENTIRLLTVISRSNIFSASSSYDGAFNFTLFFVGGLKLWYMFVSRSKSYYLLQLKT